MTSSSEPAVRPSSPLPSTSLENHNAAATAVATGDQFPDDARTDILIAAFGRRKENASTVIIHAIWWCEMHDFEPLVP
jgi:hypothetical protein